MPVVTGLSHFSFMFFFNINTYQNLVFYAINPYYMPGVIMYAIYNCLFNTYTDMIYRQSGKNGIIVI